MTEVLPAWDAAMWKEAKRRTNDPEVCNAMTVYECRWMLGERHHWPPHDVQCFTEAEQRLTQAIHK